MNNLYHKIAVASVCTALGFALGANKEAKAATITLTQGLSFYVYDMVDMNGTYLSDGIGDGAYPASWVQKDPEQEHRTFFEFNIGNLSQTTNTVISRAIFLARIYNITLSGLMPTEIYGYVGNGNIDVSDFQAGVILAPSLVVGGVPRYYNSPVPSDILKFDVTQFVQERVNNRDAFAGFGLRISNNYPYDDYRLQRSFPYKGSFNLAERSLIIETADVAEPVPEPTTIFGSALALGVGGWLKRKKSSQQDKTAPQR
jgi:hypothetical protein